MPSEFFSARALRVKPLSSGSLVKILSNEGSYVQRFNYISVVASKLAAAIKSNHDITDRLVYL